MITPHDHLLQRIFIFGCLLVGLLTSSVIAPANAQGAIPILDPPPGSTLTTSSVTFTGGHGGQATEQHWAYVGNSPGGLDYFHGPPNANHQFTASGLPTTGTIYVRYFSRPTNSGSWSRTTHAYTMNVGSGGPRVQTCPAGDTNCLITAITIANGSGNPEIIRLAAGTYALDSFDNGTNLLPRISGDITIQGAGTDRTIITSDIRPPFSGPFTTFQVLEFGTFNIFDLSVIKEGFGIKNDGTTLLENVTISRIPRTSSNPVEDEAGIVNNQTGSMTITNSIVARNGGAMGSGGGIVNHGTMEITGSTIKNNGQEFYGGIENHGRLTLKDSTVEENSVSFGGGGLGNLSGGLIEISNCLIRNNRADEAGGGIINRGEMTILKTIIVGNETFSTTLGKNGGGIFNSGPLSISQTVIANNTAGRGGGIFNSGDLNMNQTVVVGNEASLEGGGGIFHTQIGQSAGRLTLTETVITNNTPDDCLGCP